jgi:hypothetical protein
MPPVRRSRRITTRSAHTGHTAFMDRRDESDQRFTIYLCLIALEVGTWPSGVPPELAQRIANETHPSGSEEHPLGGPDGL